MYPFSGWRWGQKSPHGTGNAPPRYVHPPRPAYVQRKDHDKNSARMEIDPIQHQATMERPSSQQSLDRLSSVTSSDQPLELERGPTTQLIRGSGIDGRVEHLTKRLVELQMNENTAKHDIKTLQAENTNIRRLSEHFKVRYDYIVKKFITPYAISKDLSYGDKGPDSINAVMNPMLEDACAAGTLREQVHTLQLEIFANVQKIQATSDDQLAQEFRNPASTIKPLTRGVQIKDSEDLTSITRDIVLNQGANDSVWSSRARKKLLLEAIIWSILIVTIFHTPFSVFGERGEVLGRLWNDMFGSGHFGFWPKPTFLSETFKHTTVEGLKNVAKKEAGPSETVSSAHVNESPRACLIEIFSRNLARICSNVNMDTVSAIVTKAITLALHMAEQHCRLQIIYPAVGDGYYQGKAAPEMISITASEDVMEGRVGFIVNPGLAKWGDAHGKNLDQRLDLVPSLVYVEAIEKNRDADKMWHLPVYLLLMAIDDPSCISQSHCSLLLTCLLSMWYFM
ncbi:hypothetical protein K491DRAFT_714065 [Lophiostoma macrostomum CBS 122681]|uniref:Uncharacterized protein n=1 Tax=Lophiostoma macrostomum CBS 122681 TaxID=1314788 RepID=A0A6A6TES0_9PLEO|nr:hypothetical protein K491DRAFT_714065 [Lophiostoma macrostomum CBS 122681]